LALELPLCGIAGWTSHTKFSRFQPIPDLTEGNADPLLTELNKAARITIQRNQLIQLNHQAYWHKFRDWLFLKPPFWVPKASI